ncbi:MAG: nucleotide exchange factor GrpE, partial [Victivallales bacterium]|nr:nucleotide exchange factor GrpE [Victivallales bacterium]
MTQEENKDIKEPEAEVQEVKEEQSAAPEVQAAPEEPSLEEQLDDMRCNYLRALAEIENYRKRTARELQEERTKTRSRTITDVLGVYDLLQMAVDHAATATDMDA